ncbi:MAG: DUF2937 family protein [Pseudomonadota bacterium]
MLRQLLLLVFAALGAAVLSQGPSFADQYVQNLSGRIDELQRSIVAIERDVAANLGRDESVSVLRARREKLTEHRGRLADAPPGLRLVELIRGYDREVADSALFDFQPSLPLTIEGGLHAVGGFLIGRVLGWLLLSGLGSFRRRSRTA